MTTNRLPTPGGDYGDWGTILNAFLSVSHNSDGTIMTNAIAQAGGVTSVNDLQPDNGNIALSSKDLNDFNISSPTDNQILVYDATINQWKNQDQIQLTSPLTSVFGRTGSVTAKSGDYTAAQVGALSATDDLSVISSTNTTAGDVSMNSHKLTNLANGSADSDAVNFSQIPYVPFEASDSVLLAFNYDSALASYGTFTFSVGVIYLYRINIRSNITVSNLWVRLNNTPTGLSNTYVGLYDPSGVLLTGSSDQSSNFQTNYTVKAPFTTPQTLAPGFVYAAILVGAASTTPLVVTASLFTYTPNLGGPRFASGGSGLTALPTNLVTAGIVTTNSSPTWIGLS